ncbi:hypothetical protein D9613_009633 [Agrocybe pediades]|uniref:Uncharacterized protein n=1 Tax=Agrocybe pediades TaxID=84607 RepID=A0A8H4VTU7_9AGAR|nr:hypothetical protein D9613_009633 [Agrocybe pediades]
MNQAQQAPSHLGFLFSQPSSSSSSHQMQAHTNPQANPNLLYAHQPAPSPNPNPAPNQPPSRASIRAHKLHLAELELAREEADAFHQLSSHHFQVLVRTFEGVKMEFADLDGMSLSGLFLSFSSLSFAFAPPSVSQTAKVS